MFHGIRGFSCPPISPGMHWFPYLTSWNPCWTVDTYLDNFVGKAVPCFSLGTSVSPRHGEGSRRTRLRPCFCPAGGRSTIWTIVHPGQPQAKPKITVSTHRNALCFSRFPGNQITSEVNSVVRLWVLRVWRTSMRPQNFLLSRTQEPPPRSPLSLC